MVEGLACSLTVSKQPFREEATWQPPGTGFGVVLKQRGRTLSSGPCRSAARAQVLRHSVRTMPAARHTVQVHPRIIGPE